MPGPLPGNELLIEMCQRLDAGTAVREENRKYYAARQPMAFIAPESRRSVDSRFGRLAVNVCAVAVRSVVERLRLVGLESPYPIWAEFLRLDLDAAAEVIHTEMCVHGSAFLLIWIDANGAPTATVESCENVAVKRDPISGATVAAIKRIRVRPTPTTTGYTECWLYGSDEILHYKSNSPGGAGEYELLDSTPNPLGKVPVVPFVNQTLLPSYSTDPLYLEDAGISDLDDIKPLVDSLNAVLAGQATAVEWTAKPRRWATGLELTEKPRVDDAGEPVLDESGEQIIDTVSPIAFGPDMITLDAADAKVGQLPGADLDGFTNAANLILQNIMMVTNLTPSMCGVTTANPSTAEAIRAAESGLTSRAEAKTRMVSKPWEAAARLIWAIKSGADVDSIQVRVLFGDPSARSLAAESDSAQKLYASGILSRTAILRRLGFTDDEIATELQNVQQDAALGHDMAIGRYVRDTIKPSTNPTT